MKKIRKTMTQGNIVLRINFMLLNPLIFPFGVSVGASVIGGTIHDVTLKKTLKEFLRFKIGVLKITGVDGDENLL